MFKPKVKAAQPTEEVEEAEEEIEDEIETMPEVPAGIKTTFQRKEEPKEEVEDSNEEPTKITRMEVLDMIDGHVIRIKQLLDMIRE